MAISPLLFITYLDHLLKRERLLEHRALAFADDLAFIANSKTEVCTIVNKLRRIAPHLQLNLTKSAILPIGDPSLKPGTTFMDLPVVGSYKYLGSWVSTNTTEVLDRARNHIKQKAKLIASRTRQLRPDTALRCVSAFILGSAIFSLAPFAATGALPAEKITKIYSQILRQTIGVSRSANSPELLEALGAGRVASIYLKLSNKLGETPVQVQLARQEIMTIEACSTVPSKGFTPRLEALQLSRHHIQLVNLLSPVWILRRKIVLCRAHHRPLGQSHLCDPALAAIALPKNWAAVITLEETEAKVLLNRVRTRLKDIKNEKGKLITREVHDALDMIVDGLMNFTRTSWLLGNRQRAGGRLIE